MRLRLFSFNIQLRRHVDLIGDVFAVLFALAHTLGKKIFDLPVDRAEIILCPGGDSGVELGRETQRDLLFLLIVHINRGCPS